MQNSPSSYRWLVCGEEIVSISRFCIVCAANVRYVLGFIFQIGETVQIYAIFMASSTYAIYTTSSKKVFSITSDFFLILWNREGMRVLKIIENSLIYLLTIFVWLQKLVLPTRLNCKIYKYKSIWRLLKSFFDNIGFFLILWEKRRWIWRWLWREDMWVLKIIPNDPIQLLTLQFVARLKWVVLPTRLKFKKRL